jgi:hypothetical protein
MMEIGPLEYVVLGFEDQKFTSEVLPELNAIQENGLIQVVDLLSSADSGKLAQLKLLGELHDSGILTDDEFEREKQRILRG